MLKLEVFDPPMCCSTGICGSSVDPTLVTFASDLEWLKKQGINVIRHGLSFEPAKFVDNESIKNMLQSVGNTCLPILVVNNELVSKGCYPSRKKLAELCKIEFNEEEAPPVHREENCCCGVDCDCSKQQSYGGAYPGTECDCTNASAEENCFCSPNVDCHTSAVRDKLKKIIFIIVILLITLILAVKLSSKAGAVEIKKNSQIISLEKFAENINF